MKADVLRRPFPPEQVKQRQGQNGKVLSFVETHAVIARLNEAVDAWSFEIARHEVLEEEVVVVGRLTADGVVKMSFGGAQITRDRSGRLVSIADDLKAAGSDALKKAASLLGVGLELYGGAREEPIAKTSTLPDRDDQRGQEAAPRLEPGDRLTQRQLAAIHGAARRRNMVRGGLERFVQNRTGKQRAELLSRREASDLISELTGSNGHG